MIRRVTVLCPNCREDYQIIEKMELKPEADFRKLTFSYRDFDVVTESVVEPKHVQFLVDELHLLREKNKDLHEKWCDATDRARYAEHQLRRFRPLQRLFHWVEDQYRERVWNR